MAEYLSLMHSQFLATLTDGWGIDVLVVYFSVYFSSVNLFCLPLIHVIALTMDT